MLTCTSRGHNSSTNVKKYCITIPIKILYIFMYIQKLVKFCPLVLKILSGNEILRQKFRRYQNGLNDHIKHNKGIKL